jgi:prevent-host-death family protein
MWLHYGMNSVGIRELKNNLSRYVRKVIAGERVLVTDHGRVVAQLIPVDNAKEESRYEYLVASGVIRPPLESGDPLADFPRLRLRKGTAAALLSEDRGDK